MDSNILKEFLVSLGYKVNEASERNFVASLAKITAATQVAAAGVVAGVAKMAQALDGLYWASQRAQASADNLEAFGYQISQMGGSADAAKASVERLGMSLRFNPGTQGLLHALGVQATDSAQAMEQLGAKFRAMSPVLAHAYAGAFGIDDRQLFAMLQGGGQYAEEYRRTRAQAGLSSANAAEEGHKFNVLMNSLGVTFKTLRELSSVALMKGIGMDVQKLNNLIRKHFGEISDVISKAGKIILGVGEGIWRLMWRLEQLWNSLDGWQRQVVLAFAGIVTAWQLLNLSFLRSPLGIILLLAAAIALLYDDYQTWKEHGAGHSLIDWSKWKPAIDAAIQGIHKIIDVLGDLASWLGMDGGVKGAFELLATFVAGAWATKMILGIGRVAGKLTPLLRMLGSIPVLLGLLGIAGYEADKEGDHAYSADQLGLGSGFRDRPSLDEYMHNHPPGGTPGVSEQGAASVPNIFSRGWETFKRAVGGKTRGMRNNNPLNLKFAEGQGAAGKDNQGFGVYSTMEGGISAAVHQLRIYASRGLTTLRQMISKWAPPSENDTENYIQRVSRKVGLGPDSIVDVNDEDLMGRIVSAMSLEENSKAPDKDTVMRGVRLAGTNYSPLARVGSGASALDQRMRQLRQQVGAQALGNSSGLLSPAPIAPGAGAATGGAATGGNATISQNTTINVTGSGDPQQVANLVTSGQARVNEGLVRGARGAVAVQ